MSEPLQSSTSSVFHPRVLFTRLSSLIHRSTPKYDAPSKLQQPPTPLRLDRHTLLARLSSLLPHLPLNTDEETKLHPTTPSGSSLDALIHRLPPTPIKKLNSRNTWGVPILSKWLQCGTRRFYLLVRRQPPPPPPKHITANPVTCPRVVHYTACSGTNPTTPRHPPSLPVRSLAHLVLFLYCTSPQHANENVQPMQQQGQPQGQAHAHRHRRLSLPLSRRP